MVERGGFEPPKAEPADLQSAPFDRFGTSPFFQLVDGGRKTKRHPALTAPRIAYPQASGRSPLNEASDYPIAILFCFARSPITGLAPLPRAVRFFPSLSSGLVIVSERSRFGPGAGDGTRTRNLLITNQLLYQLSYAS